MGAFPEAWGHGSLAGPSLVLLEAKDPEVPLSLYGRMRHSMPLPAPSSLMPAPLGLHGGGGETSGG